jgi:hypothetical protein
MIGKARSKPNVNRTGVNPQKFHPIFTKLGLKYHRTQRIDLPLKSGG